MIHTFPSGPILTNSYLVACPNTLECVIIDPAPGSLEQLEQAIAMSQLTPIAIWLTHSHWDHIADACAAKERYDIPLYVHPLDKGNVEKPGSDGIPAWVDAAPTTVDDTFEEGEFLKVGSLRFLVIHTPGHSPGSVCFYCEEEDILISGDTLFQGSIGILTIPGGSPEAMWTSLEKLEKLPGVTEVYPGHGPATTIAAEEWLPKAKVLFS